MHLRNPSLLKEGCRQISESSSCVKFSRTRTVEDKCVEMAQRLTYRRRHCYATQSNKTRKVKTPGTSSSAASWI